MARVLQKTNEDIRAIHTVITPLGAGGERFESTTDTIRDANTLDIA